MRNKSLQTDRARYVFVIWLSAVAVAAVVAGLLLRAHAPGNMGNGFLVGALLAVAATGVAAWRATTRPEHATTFERAFTQSGDERDDAVLTRAFAVLGVATLPLTGVAAVAAVLGADVAMVMALLLCAQFAIAAVAFVVINRRS